MPTTPVPDERAEAEALVNVVGSSKWMAVALAWGYLAVVDGHDDEYAAREVYARGGGTLRQSREFVARMRAEGFVRFLPPRERTGPAENPITKLFPATVTEERFLESLDELHVARGSVTYLDDRQANHSLTDFTLLEGEDRLPLNIKNAGTRFARAADLVGLEPDDCIPIPAYKANAAVRALPSLVYVVCPDYDLVGHLETLLPNLMTPEETIVWRLLNQHSGTRLQSAEDAFVFATVRRYWDDIKAVAAAKPFFVISARKALRVLQTKPERTPGIGLRAWGTGASAEVNVHVSLNDEMTPWVVVRDRIVRNGISDIIEAVNRRRVEEVYDPEI